MRLTKALLITAFVLAACMAWRAYVTQNDAKYLFDPLQPLLGGLSFISFIAAIWQAGRIYPDHPAASKGILISILAIAAGLVILNTYDAYRNNAPWQEAAKKPRDPNAPLRL